MQKQKNKDLDLFKKYNTAGPRYTSYPTVPFWQTELFSTRQWEQKLKQEKQNISLYIHLPYCESLCTFCACHKRITTNHSVEDDYINSVLAEWKLYTQHLGFRPIVSELHLGGGTPSFFSPANLERMVEGIFEMADKSDISDFSWEGHPNNTSKEHLSVLYKHGFERVSFGVQDYDLAVQKAIHRIQPFENVKRVSQEARELGYTSISHDLVFGLPFQTFESISDTICKTLTLNPDRIAFYSYAHVPWIKGNGQRGFSDEDLPNGPQKRKLYEYGKKLLEDNGYFEVGMDHFAKKSDPLFEAMEKGTLHRNFMGYTVQKTSMLIGLGVSAISDIGSAYAQNIKEINSYKEAIANGQLPILKGHILTDQDLLIKEQILNIMCRFKTSWNKLDWNSQWIFELLQDLKTFENDGLVKISAQGLEVTKAGIPFVRNIAMLFDQYLTKNTETQNLFSKTV